MGRAHHIRRCGASFHLRRVVPADLRGRLGRGELVRAIRHGDESRRHLLSRRFWLACEEVFSIVRANPTLPRQSIDRLVAVYLDDLRSRDLAHAAGSPRRGADAPDWSRIGPGMYEDLAQGVVEARRSNAQLFDDSVVLDLAARAGLATPLAGTNSILIQDALGLALAQFYDRRAAELRAEARLGRPGILVRFLEALGLGRPIGSPPTDLRRAQPDSESEEPAANREECGSQEEACAALFEEAEDNPGVAPTFPVLPEKIAEPAATAGPLPRADDPASPKPKSEKTFEDLWEVFIRTKIDLRREWKASRRPELLATGRLWSWIVGDVPAASITSAHVRQFHDAFLALPDDYMRLRVDKKRGILTPEAIVELARARADKAAKRAGRNSGEIRQVDPKTFNKHLGNLKKFFEWCGTNGSRSRDASDPTGGFHIKVAKSTLVVRAERNMAPVQAIVELFASPYWTGRLSSYFMTQPGTVIVRDALYWCVLIIAFHGLRREEAAQLRVRHIKFIDIGADGRTLRIWYFDLTAADLSLKEPEKGSPRLVPFHWKFERSGFLEDKVFGRGEDELLFSELNNENAHRAFGVSVGKRFGNYVRAIAFSQESFADDLSLQSMRHTVRTLLDNTSAKTAFVDELLGHESDERRSEGRRYRKEIFLLNLKRTIDLLDLPVDVDRLHELAEKQQRK